LDQQWLYNVSLRDHERSKPNEGQTKTELQHMIFNKRLRHPTDYGNLTKLPVLKALQSLLFLKNNRKGCPYLYKRSIALKLHLSFF